MCTMDFISRMTIHDLQVGLLTPLIGEVSNVKDQFQMIDGAKEVIYIPTLKTVQNRDVSCYQPSHI